ncbi:MAG: exo-alpha-sialidase [Bryobacter sp.]|nr:exo-alpha-sialidase [Bryobacter sp.]
MYDSAPFPSCHASTLVESPAGEIVAAWFGGTDEGEKDVAIWGARRVSGKWTAPEEWARETNIPTWNPVLFYTKDKNLHLYYKYGPSPREWTGAVKNSLDHGRTWTPAEYLPAGVLGPIKNKPLVLNDGTIVSGTSVESYRAWTCWVERSTDNGENWTKHGPIVVPGEAYGIIQPAIVPMDNRGQRLKMYARSTQRIGKVVVSDSNDAGRTWTPGRPINLPNPNSGVDAVRLKDGRIVIIYNHTPKGRTPLNIAVSRDGETWSEPLALETEPGEFSYPAIIQASDGTIHATYTWNRKKIRYAQIPLADLPPAPGK